MAAGNFGWHARYNGVARVARTPKAEGAPWRCVPKQNTIAACYIALLLSACAHTHSIRTVPPTYANLGCTAAALLCQASNAIYFYFFSLLPFWHVGAPGGLAYTGWAHPARFRSGLPPPSTINATLLRVPTLPTITVHAGGGLRLRLMLLTGGQVWC